MITITNLTKRYGPQTAVDDISFTCAEGTVTGFLGPNGAGKSTTLRMLTGLTLPTAGSATIGGRRYADLPNPGRVVGVMLDASAQNTGRTGLETMHLAAAVTGVSMKRADEMLERVGLTAAAKKRVGQYSLGMRQRLGIGVAMIGDPQLLLLDEPANGLDPEGIRWMRGLLTDFARAGGTVLLSSHLLREVEATVDQLVVIGNGRIVAQGTLDELLTSEGVKVTARDQNQLAAALDGAGISFERLPSGELLVAADPGDIGALALREQIVLTGLSAHDGGGLEDLFFQLTDAHPAQSAPTAPVAA